MHSLPRNQEEIVNDYIREWKKHNYRKCEIGIEEILEAEFEIKLTEIELTEEGIKRENFNRAKEKRKTKELIKEYYEEIEEKM